MPTKVGISSRQRNKISTNSKIRIGSFFKIEPLQSGDTDLRRYDGLCWIFLLANNRKINAKYDKSILALIHFQLYYLD